MAKNTEKKLKPVSKKVAEIVTRLAEAHVVEDLIRNVTRHSIINANLADLSQIIYFALLQTDQTRLEHLEESGQMRFYIVRMISNQYFSENSPYYKENRKFSRRTTEIDYKISDSYEAGKDYLPR